ncbi:MAG: beta-ketoacyl synthase N-terminal-like domain-containing protein [Smithellaceae bacterium]
MSTATNDQNKPVCSMPVIAAGYLGPSLAPNQDVAWDEAGLPHSPDDLVQKMMGQPMRRAGRFIKLVCCGALACLQNAPKEALQDKKVGIFLATGLGNIDEILPFITQVFKHDGGFPSPNQFANSVSNAAAFFLARVCEVKGVVLTISQEEHSFESALWLAQSYLEAGDIDLALVGGCDVFTPSVDDYRERMDLKPDNARLLPMGEGSSWLLMGRQGDAGIGRLDTVILNSHDVAPESLSCPLNVINQCESAVAFAQAAAEQKILLPGFRLITSADPQFSSAGWDMDDYLPHCGISPTAAAYGIARALLAGRKANYVHYNYHPSGRQALVAVTKM